MQQIKVAGRTGGTAKAGREVDGERSIRRGQATAGGSGAGEASQQGGGGGDKGRYQVTVSEAGGLRARGSLMKQGGWIGIGRVFGRCEGSLRRKRGADGLV